MKLIADAIETLNAGDLALRVAGDLALRVAVDPAMLWFRTRFLGTTSHTNA